MHVRTCHARVREIVCGVVSGSACHGTNPRVCMLTEPAAQEGLPRSTMACAMLTRLHASTSAKQRKQGTARQREEEREAEDRWDAVVLLSAHTGLHSILCNHETTMGSPTHARPYQKQPLVMCIL